MMRDPSDYNPEAFGAHIRAEIAYLESNGWESGADLRWSHPGKSLDMCGMKAREGLDRSHAVNVQKQFDQVCAAYVERMAGKR